MKPYFERGGVTLWHGDSLEILPGLENFDAAIMDPPYGVLLTAKRAKMRDGGVSVRAGSYCFDDTPDYISTVVIPIVRECVSRAKSVAITPGTRNLWLYPPGDDVGCFYSAGGTGLGRWGFSCSQPILFYGSDPYLRTGRGARANSCGKTYPNDANEIDHPCAKPISMMLWLVNRASLEQETVLDPFAGSGSTLVAAWRLQRKAIGIEIEERYCEIAAKRLEREMAQGDLFRKGAA